MSGVNLTMTDLGGYSATMTDAGTDHACVMTDAPRALPSVAIQASLGMSAGAAMGLGALRPARVASLGMSASAAMGISADMVPAAAQLALGAWFPPVGPLWSHDHAQNYHNAVGVKPNIVHWYQDTVNNKLWNQYGDISAATTQNVVPLITYELWDYTAGATQSGYTNAAIIAGTHDAVITAFATAAAAWGRPFLLRPFHEMTYKSYPWAAGPGNPNGNSPTSFIAAWQHVWHLFRNAGANNAKFVWCPSVPLPGVGDLTLCYPGTAYVDWLSLDGYAWPVHSNLGWQLFGPCFQAGYDQVTALGPQPVIIAETGAEPTGGDKSVWIADMAATATHLFPRLKAIVWFNSVDNHDWRFNDTVGHLNAYQAAAALPAMSGTVTP